MVIYHIDMVILDIDMGDEANDMGDDSIDTVISHIDMGYLVTLRAAHRPPSLFAGNVPVYLCTVTAASSLRTSAAHESHSQLNVSSTFDVLYVFCFHEFPFQLNVSSD